MVIILKIRITGDWQEFSMMSGFLQLLKSIFLTGLQQPILMKLILMQDLSLSVDVKNYSDQSGNDFTIRTVLYDSEKQIVKTLTSEKFPVLAR